MRGSSERKQISVAYPGSNLLAPAFHRRLCWPHRGALRSSLMAPCAPPIPESWTIDRVVSLTKADLAEALVASSASTACTEDGDVADLASVTSTDDVASQASAIEAMLVQQSGLTPGKIQNEAREQSKASQMPCYEPREDLGKRDRDFALKIQEGLKETTIDPRSGRRQIPLSPNL